MGSMHAVRARSCAAGQFLALFFQNSRVSGTCKASLKRFVVLEGCAPLAEGGSCGHGRAAAARFARSLTHAKECIRGLSCECP